MLCRPYPRRRHSSVATLETKRIKVLDQREYREIRGFNFVTGPLPRGTNKWHDRIRGSCSSRDHRRNQRRTCITIFCTVGPVPR